MNREAKKKLTLETRRRELVIAALQAVQKHGFLNATIDNISRESGLSRGLISRYFANKEDLLVFSFRYLTQNLNDFHRHVVRTTEGGALEKLLASAYCPFLEPGTYAETWLHFWSASCVQPLYREIHTDLWGRYRTYVSRRLAQAADDRNMTIDVRASAINFTQLIDGLCLGLMLENAFDRAECRYVLRNWLCQLFREDPSKFPLTPAFDLLNYTTEAPL